MILLVFVILCLIAAAITAVHAYVNDAKDIAAILAFGVIVGVIALLTGGLDA